MDTAPVPSSMSATDFSELLELVPDLLTLLTQSTKKALMSSNRAFCKQIQQATISIKFSAEDEEDARLLVSRHGPYLRRLDLSIAEFNMGDCSQMALVTLGQWPFLTSLDLASNSMDRDDMATSPDLAQLHWPRLAFLSLAGTKLTLSERRDLGQHKWHCLKTLVLSCCGADAAGLAELSKGSFPLLQTLELLNSMRRHAVHRAPEQCRMAAIEDAELVLQPFG